MSGDRGAACLPGRRTLLGRPSRTYRSRPGIHQRGTGVLLRARPAIWGTTAVRTARRIVAEDEDSEPAVGVAVRLLFPSVGQLVHLAGGDLRGVVGGVVAVGQRGRYDEGTAGGQEQSGSSRSERSPAHADETLRQTVAAASPDLAGQVQAILGGRSPKLRRVRRAVLAVARYAIRYARRSTPCGLGRGHCLLRQRSKAPLEGTHGRHGRFRGQLHLRGRGWRHDTQLLQARAARRPGPARSLGSVAGPDIGRCPCRGP
ncbi:lantibiotic dehydratase [Streptomyces fildesensis]|uniref:Lantibiotic dehydratase n=1 Tax=Streptomyces fildesensis TaxID=375757 RepID=A0ABW8CG79_9ACTN